MTNVKLKLMFFLLNSLLSADIIHARPYSDKNNTDIVIKFTTDSNNTFNIPVDSNSDTLIVASDDETPEETNKSSNNQLEAIVNAEQDRDEAMSKKVMTDQVSILEVNKKDAAAIENQLNTSSSVLDDIIDSETDREETLTDILFRPESEFTEDMPRFEFLIAAKINSSDVSNNRSVVKDDGFSDNRLEKDRNSSDVLRKVDYVELVEVPTKISENKSAYLMNITGHELDNDLAPDTSFTDLQTLFLACFGTLLPLLAVLFATLLIRCMCRRWCPGWCKKSTGSSVSESSEKDAKQQLKSPTEEDTSHGETLENGEAAPANGSIFTMTLKNNHLIVETEERNDITKNGRETKMKYSPDNDGIFVVEVQQSQAYRPNNKSLQSSPPHDPQISTNQALIHRVPEDLDKTNEHNEKYDGKFERDRALALSSTGLSISDLSMSSIGSHNVSYSYGGQVGYEQGPFGYPVYAGYNISKDDMPEGIIHDNSQEPLISKTPTDPDKPVVTAAIFKQDSIIGNDALQGPGYCIEGSTDGPLLSDVQAREYSLQHLLDQRDNKVENGVAVPVPEKIESPKKALSRADSLPVRLENDNVVEAILEKNNVMETITEDEMPKDLLKGKRASLPIIRTEMYESVKDALLPSGSPKFEKLLNETSPGDGGFEAPPMITITEESDTGKTESAS
ncbi:uncharacterized protein LOC128675028 isoform X2 [Plodia interpunctella]|uniref:uncharacterized protein LOC128675028 isoform X2 n=1 Tax=Plodia interpunctella TaxID=58824 RepID=UPI0023686C5F|nr:uncharacterized protein LOC128675028 isoform X2 [Plodia interpunctella]